MAAATILTITDAVCSFAVGATEPPDWSAVTVNNYSCQVTTAALNPTVNVSTAPATFCEGETDVPGKSKWTLDLAGLQDWTVAAGLSMFLLDNEAAEGWVQIEIPTQEPGDPIATATSHVRFVPGTFAGPAGSPLTFEVSLPVQGTPAIVAGVAA